MTSLFDGVSTLLSDVFGSDVTYTAAGEQPQVLRAVFRRGPVTAVGDDGADILLTAPTLRVSRALIAAPQRGDTLVAEGQTWRILNAWPQGSPAVDAHYLCELELVAP